MALNPIETLLSRVQDQNAQQLLHLLLEQSPQGLAPETLEALENSLRAGAEQARYLSAALERITALEVQVIQLQELITAPAPAPVIPTDNTQE